MGLTLDDLIAPQTQEAARLQILTAATGLGVPLSLGLGSGVLSVTGTPLGTYLLVISILSSAGGAAVTFTYSLDGGTTTSAPQTPDGSGNFALGGTGLTLNFAAPSSGAFLAGDVFTAKTFSPPLPVTAWQPGDAALVLIEVFAAAVNVLRNLVKKIAAGGLLKFSSGDWLTAHAQNFYDTDRAAGQATNGNVTLADAFGTGPYSITPGSLLVQTAGGLRYRSAETKTLPLNGTITLLVQAEGIGIQYNLGGAALTILGTPLPGVTVTNAINWITQQGTNTESDPDLIARCIGKWNSLAPALNSAGYVYYAKAAAPGTVTRAQAFVDSDPAHAGRVLLYVAGSSGPVADSVVAVVQAAVFPRVPLTGDLITQSAPVQSFAVTGSVYYFSSFATSIQLSVETVLIAFFASIPVGGVVYFSQLVGVIQNVAGVRDVTLTYPVADTSLALGQVPAFVDSLVYVGV